MSETSPIYAHDVEPSGVDLSKEEAAALLCGRCSNCHKCSIFDKVADIGDCWEYRIRAYRKLKAYIERVD